MNHAEPPDYSALSFGAGLALGLLLILALPREPKRNAPAPAGRAVARVDAR